MATRKNTVGGRRNKRAAAKRQPPRTAAWSADRAAREIPLIRDLEFVEREPLPPPVEDRVIHSVPDAFTGRVCATLKEERLAAFYGSRLKPERILRDVEMAHDATAASARFIHGAELAAQIGAPALVRLLDIASLIVRDFDELVAQEPSLADGLADLTDWWAATFPGGGPKSKTENAGSPPPAKSPAPGSTPTTAAPVNPQAKAAVTAAGNDS